MPSHSPWSVGGAGSCITAAVAINEPVDACDGPREERLAVGVARRPRERCSALLGARAQYSAPTSPRSPLTVGPSHRRARGAGAQTALAANGLATLEPLAGVADGSWRHGVGGPGPWVARSRLDLQERHEGEGALVKARMRDHEPRGVDCEAVDPQEIEIDGRAPQRSTRRRPRRASIASSASSRLSGAPPYRTTAAALRNSGCGGPPTGVVAYTRDVVSTAAMRARSAIADRIVASRSPRLAPRPTTARKLNPRPSSSSRRDPSRHRGLEDQRVGQRALPAAVDQVVLNEEEGHRGVERDGERDWHARCRVEEHRVFTVVVVATASICRGLACESESPPWKPSLAGFAIVPVPTEASTT